MFSPSQADVRRFFCSVYAKAQAGQALEAIEIIASQWIDEHPEYHAELADTDAAPWPVCMPKTRRTNPFLHLSIRDDGGSSVFQHRPTRGIRQAVELLARRRNSLHDAHHEVMDALGQMLWKAGARAARRMAQPIFRCGARTCHQ